MIPQENRPPVSPGNEDETLPISVSVNKFGEIICRAAPGKESENEKTQSVLAMAIGRFKIRRRLGRGTFGTVYLGYDDQLEREVAVKVPNVNIAEDSRDEVQDLFLREARQLAQVKHPNIVVVHDVGFTDDGCYVVSQYIEGPDLNNWMQENVPTWQESVQIVASLAEGLSATHTEGVIHRDVKPANIIISERTEGPIPILVDFGLAISESIVGAVGARRGDITGTPNYMSPEQARGEGHRIDGRTDIYSLGVVLYRLLTGQLPFVARDVFELLEEIAEDEPRPLRQIVHTIPRELEEICLKAIAKNLTDRYTTAGDLAEDLRGLLRKSEQAVSSSEESSIIQAIPHARRALSETKPNLRILVAEDNPVSRLKLVSTLEKWGHSVVEAEDGEKAWALFQKEKFSVVITDWMMPNVDGLELVKRIRAARTSSYTYVIMLTAKSEKHDMVLGMGAGADDFLAKPFQKDELNVRLRAGKRIVDMSLAIGRSGKRIDRGILAAAKIQRAFLPNDVPEMAEFSFAWEYHPCEDLGGDMLNIVELDENNVAIYVLDVNGSGVPASLLATTVSRVMAPSSDSASILFDRSSGDTPTIREPSDVAEKLNEQFSGGFEQSQYFTIVYGILNRETLEFRFTCAGHPPFLLEKNGGDAAFVEGFGLPIGVSGAAIDFDQESIQLSAGDRLFLFSNGLPNTPNRDDELFNFERVSDALTGKPGTGITEAVGNLLQKVNEFGDHAELDDDIAILAVEVNSN